MKLSVKQRLNFSVLYPQEGNLIIQLLVKGIAEKVGLKQEEVEAIELKQEGDRLTWKEEKAADKEISFSETEHNFLKQQVAKLDEEGRVTQDLLDLCLLIQDAKEKPLG